MNKCEKCRFKYCEDYESQCYVCKFGFDECSLKHTQKEKLSKLMIEIENENKAIFIEAHITKEQYKNNNEKIKQLVKEYNEYSEKLAKQGKYKVYE